jgi:hypothetical protein
VTLMSELTLAPSFRFANDMTISPVLSLRYASAKVEKAGAGN